MKKQAFTLIEVSCVIIILAITTSVLTPVFANSKLESKASLAKKNLHNFWIGIKLYQSNYDEKVPYGSPQDMGLPPEASNFGKFVSEFTGDTGHTWRTKSKFLPCGKSVGSEDFEGLGYMPLVKSDWPSEVLERRDNTILMYDKNCNVPETRVMCQFCDKRSIGITLSGTIRDRINSDWKVYDQHFYQ
jgi:prepilin-type N-terminal cleavage/methylation domain-containing protein